MILVQARCGPNQAVDFVEQWYIMGSPQQVIGVGAGPVQVLDMGAEVLVAGGAQQRAEAVEVVQEFFGRDNGPHPFKSLADLL